MLRESVNKIVINEKQAVCLCCCLCPGVEIKDGVVVCKRCGSDDLLDATGRMFQPIFNTDPNATFKASKYTPELPDRRKSSRRFPRHKERRRAMFV